MRRLREQVRDPRPWVVAAGLFTALIVAVVLAPDRPAATFESLSAPGEAIPGGEVVLTGVLDSRVAPLTCLVVTQAYVLRGRAPDPEWFVKIPVVKAGETKPAKRGRRVVSTYRFRLPVDVAPGVAELMIRETYFCDDRRTAAVVDSPAKALVVRSAK